MLKRRGIIIPSLRMLRKRLRFNKNNILNNYYSLEILKKSTAVNVYLLRWTHYDLVYSKQNALSAH